MSRVRYQTPLPQLPVIVEKLGVGISCDVLSTVGAENVKAILLVVSPTRLDPLDKASVCDFEQYVP
jgi:hypothetical protein